MNSYIMKFYHVKDSRTEYTLRETGSNFIVTWDEEGSEKSWRFTQEEVDDNLMDGTWVIVE